MPKGQTPALTPDTADRYRRVMDLRARGLTFEEIAQEVGYAGRQGAKEAYDAALRWWGREAVDDLRTVEGERLELLWRRVYARVARSEDLGTVEFARLLDSAVRLSQRKAALWGLDAPRQYEVTGEGGGPLVTDVGELLRQRLEQIAPHALSDG
jgi:hypothetical protein